MFAGGDFRKSSIGTEYEQSLFFVAEGRRGGRGLRKGKGKKHFLFSAVAALWEGASGIQWRS